MLEGILSISGQPGLYKLVSQTKSGIIVEAVESKKRIPIYSNSKVSALEDIAVFTTGEEIPLKEIFKKIYSVENKGLASVTKTSTNDETKEYFEDILPDYDKDRVYVSDMKKLFSWYNLLVSQSIINDESIKADNELASAKNDAPLAAQESAAPADVAPAEAPKPSKAKAKQDTGKTAEAPATPKAKKASTKKA